MLGISSHASQAIDEGWQYCGVKAGAAADPSQLAGLAPEWSAAVVPGTVASAERAARGELDLERVPDYDALDWWYRCEFGVQRPAPGGASILCLDGLATLADVWLNGEHLLASDDMYVGHEVDVTHLLAGRASHTLVIRFRSLRAALATRRPRPRWRTKLVEDQQLRWHRTTLLGRMPGWSPPVRAVGPWRPIRLEHRTVVDVVRGDIAPQVEARGGSVLVALEVRTLGDAPIESARVEAMGELAALDVVPANGGVVELRGRLALPSAEPWWPHTHGAQPLYDVRVIVVTADGARSEIDFGRVGFRDVTVDRSNGGFGVRVNGSDVFCRGACWTTPDVVSLRATPAGYRSLLMAARDAGMNMIRVGGTMVYEDDAFFDACSELGILVWQDFMFANMDYPAADVGFSAAVASEAESVLARIGRQPSLAIVCGGSEVEQQAAMLGLDRELWTNALFTGVLPFACAQRAPGIPYVPSSPFGGALPFHVDTGVAHYYGVGAYLRPLEDARRSNVRFTSECLGFSNVPDQRIVDRLLPNGEAPFHHPRWKARVPRDHGTGWDFEDVRDHYLARLFDVDPMRVRYSEPERYLALSRVVTGEVMARTIGEWRRRGSTCHGALVWFYQDLWAGAGWGVLDSTGRPKAAYYALKRAMRPVAVAITDEGQNGLHVHVVNDRAEAFRGELAVALLRGATTVGEAVVAIDVESRGARTIVADELLGRFRDAAYAYRFGPPSHDVVAVTVRDVVGVVVADDFYFPLGLSNSRTDDVMISGDAERLDDRTVAIALRAERLAQFVALDTGDFVPDDNYFHMAPGTERRIVARSAIAGASFDGFALPLNAHAGVRLVLTDRVGAMGVAP